MSSKNKKPKSSKLHIIKALSEAVQPGEYQMFSGSSQFSSVFGGSVPWGGPDCQSVLIAASTWDEGSFPGLPFEETPSGNVYLWKSFRAYPGSPISKADVCLYYTNSDGEPWQIHSKPKRSDHWEEIISGSGMAEIARDRKMPSASRGTLFEYRARGAYLDFEKPLKDELGA